MGTISRDATKTFFDKGATSERRVFQYTGPASYATGGDTLNPESIGLSRIDAMIGLTISNGSTYYWGWYDQTNKKIKFVSATATEVGNGTDLSGFTGRFEAIGK